MIAGTLFSGGGLADVGLAAAGYCPSWGIEYHPPAAQIYSHNFGHSPLQDLLYADPADYCTPDYAHLSSPCQSFSGVNVDGAEHAGDIALGKQSARFIRWHQPNKLSIENVPAYGDSESFGVIMDAVRSIYRYCTIDTVDLAVFGIPQHRRRLIVRASHQPIEPLYLAYTHGSEADFFTKPYVGWHDAIKDLWETCKVSPITTKQRLSIGGYHDSLVQAPFLMERTGNRCGKALTIRQQHEPVWTIKASSGGDDKHTGNRTRVIDWITPHSECRSIGLRAVARLMGVPDSYTFPVTAKWHECWRVLGNGVPPLAMQAIAGSF